MKATMKALAEINRLMNTLVEMGFTNDGKDCFELFADDGTDVYVRFRDGDELTWKVTVERMNSTHIEYWTDLVTKEVEGTLNNIGLFDHADMDRIEEAYTIIKEYSNPYSSPREQAEALYETGFYKEYWMETDYLMKVYTFLQHPEWERGLQFDRVCKILQTISDEESWYEWKMDI